MCSTFQALLLSSGFFKSASDRVEPEQDKQKQNKQKMRISAHMLLDS